MNIKVVGIDLAKHYFQVFVLTDKDLQHYKFVVKTTWP
jgi:hypothetical protein